MRFRTWEKALAAGLLAAVLLCAMPVRTQAGLADKLIRLHVIANSDSDADQQLKLQVRDAVLAGITPEDRTVTPQLLQRLQRMAQQEVTQAGYDYPVVLQQKYMYFDTRVYDTFSLPAGYYQAVRVVIGEGAGRNWWCVLFPPLCAGVCEEELTRVARQAGLTEEEIAFIREDGTAYVVRFKIAELWGKISRFFS